ncbi:CBM35 domain-containing protein [Streptomyces sp. H27-D2]|uniref:CBM35 domain-containing protein n=1 Tax=Streptomyces sp. H27-D2 TaxID=3046304 RepID=UPI002DBB93AF|nr:carbohydrate-binding protein [Streptomyces sp. H27-D2]MEC4015599.1 carbohydrate-binding protein [Streptomyces sp. H27-D2]
MTAGNNGTGTPENDDPFAYLYHQEGGAPEDGSTGGGATGGRGGYGYPGPSTPQPGVPRTSYNQVSRVGERQYGQQQGQGAYGQQVPQQGQTHGQQPPQYGQQQANAQYGGPAPQPGGPGQPGNGGNSRGGGRGPNSKGLLIGALSVVAVVVVGIGIAMISNADDNGKDDQAQQSGGPAGGVKDKPSEDPKATKAPAGKLPKADAATMRLEGAAATGKDVPGAKANGGTYVGGLNTVGSAAIWSADVDRAGQYKMRVTYGVPGKDGDLTLSVNGKPNTKPVNMGNFTGAKAGEWDKGWTNTWSLVQLNKGTNTIKLSCETGNKCDVNLDQVWLEKPGGS